jgi:hypothetical protein
VQLALPAPRGRRLLVRLCLLACCGGLLLLLSSRPAEAAERREPGLLDPVRTTLKATAREVDSFAGRATGSGSSTVGRVADAARQAVAPHPRTAGAARPATPPTVQRGAPAVPSPVRRAAPPTHPTVRRVARAAAPGAGSPKGVLAPVAGLTGPVLRPLGPALAPVGSVLAPVGAALAPIAGPVGGLVPPLVPGGLLGVPGLGGPGNGSPAGSGTQGFAGPFARAGDTVPLPAVSQTYPARPAADGASSPATRSIRSWPALTGAVSLPGFPTSAELPAGGPDPLSTASGVGFALAALAAALVLPGLRGRGRARPDRSGVVSRSYLPLVSPA